MATPVPDSQLLGWQYGKSVLQALRHLFDTRHGADVCFEVRPRGAEGEPQETEGSQGGSTATLERAHRCVLMCRSRKFEQMLDGGREKEGGEEQHMVDTKEGIPVQDVQPEIFREVLRYVYTDEATVTAANALPLMFAAKNYLLSGLADKCQKYLQDNLAVANACSILDQSLALGETELKKRCLGFICEHVEETVKTEGFLNLSNEALEIVVGNDDFFFKSCKETDVHAACMTWAKAKAERNLNVDNPTDEQLREALGNVLYRIRYPLITAADFAKQFLNSRLFTSEENYSIVVYSVIREKDNNMKFDCSVRKNPTEQHVLERFTTLSNLPWQGVYNNGISFVTDRAIILHAVGTFASVANHNLTIQVYLNNALTNTTVAPRTTGPASQIDKIVLTQPVNVTPGAVYSIVLLATNVNYANYGTAGPGRHVIQNVTFTFSACTNLAPQSHINQGQIPKLFFTIK